MTEPFQDRAQRLEWYLDDQLSPEERQAFEAEQAGNAGLHEEILHQEKIDASLDRLFQPPKLPSGFLDAAAKKAEQLSSLERERPAGVPGRRMKQALVALAACVAWAAAGWVMLRPQNGDGYQLLALEDVYEQSVASGFEPKWVCESDREFAETFAHRQNQPLLLKGLPTGTVATGLAYLEGISPNTTTLLARVGGKPVMVFVDRVELDTLPQKPSRRSGLNLFRQELAGLVLYEITPHVEPGVMGYLVPTELPPAEKEPVAE